MEKQDLQTRESRVESKNPSDELRKSSATRPRAPARILSSEVLRTGGAVFDLSPEYLERLASAVGNGALTELLRGGGEKPETYAFTSFGSREGEDEPNRIHTVPPRLCGSEGIGVRDGVPVRAADPGSLAERLTPGSMDLFGSL